MTKIGRSLQITSLMVGMTVMFCYISWHLGYDGLILVGEINIPRNINYTICKILFSINLLLVLSFTMQEYTKKVFGMFIPILCISVILDKLNIPWLSTSFITIPYLISLSIKRKSMNVVIKRYSLITLITIGYQLLAAYFKFGSILLPRNVSLYAGLMFSIDMILIIFLIWSIGGVLDHGGRMELLVFPGQRRDDKHRNERYQIRTQNPSNIPVGKFEQLVMGSTIIFVQVLQWMFILWVCNLDNLFLDALVISTSFICHGMIISKRKHFKPIALCTLAATGMVYICARFTVSFYHSQVFSIFIGLIMVYVLYRISYEFDKRAEDKLEAQLHQIHKLNEKIEKAWEQIDNIS